MILTNSPELDRLRAALDTLNSIKSSAIERMDRFHDDNAIIDCCERSIDGIIDVIDEYHRLAQDEVNKKISR